MVIDSAPPAAGSAPGLSDEQFLQAIYGGLLGREPDPVGLQHHLQLLWTQRTDPARYRRMVEAFVAGSEFRVLAGQRLTPAGSNVFLPDLSGVTFGHVVPLGSFCHAAMALNRTGLRRFATPFDWIFSSVGMAAHAIGDDFAAFLDPAQHRSVPVAERVSPEANFGEHVFYRERFGVRFMFNHHDPAASATQAAYFRRGVQRLRQVLDSPAWKLFVVVSPAPLTLAGLQPLLAALQQRSTNFVLLVLQFNTVGGQRLGVVPGDSLRTQRLRHDVLKVELDVSAPSNGVEFADARDNDMLERLLRSFRFQPEALRA